MLRKIISHTILLPCDVVYDSFYGVWVNPLKRARTRERLSEIYDEIEDLNHGK